MFLVDNDSLHRTTSREDRRRDDRRDTHAAGCIMLDQDSRSVFCLVHNLSRSGAKLEVVQPLDPPDTFLLTIDGEPGTVRAEVVWRDGFMTGVRFIGRLE